MKTNFSFSTKNVVLFIFFTVFIQINTIIQAQIVLNDDHSITGDNPKNFRTTSGKPQILGLQETMILNESQYDVANGKWTLLYFDPTFVNADSIQWSTSGDGVFINPNDELGIYKIGSMDKWATNVDIYVQAVNFTYGDFEARDTVELVIPSQITKFHFEGVGGWTGISSYLDKSDCSVDEVMAPVVLPGENGSLIFMYDKSGNSFWADPTPPINNIGNWGPVGYQAKFRANDYLPIYGDTLDDKTFMVDGTFTYLPVFSNYPLKVEDVFSGHLNDVEFIYDWYNTNVWAQGAPGIANLLPGRAYLLQKKIGAAPFSIQFPNIDTSAAVIYSQEHESFPNFPIAWNKIKKYNESMNIFIKPIANPRINNIPLQTGDYIGVFFTNDNSELICGGAGIWSDTSIFTEILAYGDDPITQEKDGFAMSETIYYKLYSSTTQKEYNVDLIEFESQFNTWHLMNYSIVTNIKALETIDFYIEAEKTNICLGDSITLSAVEFIGTTPPYSFTWTSDPPGFYSNEQNPPPQYPNQSTTYHLTVQDEIGNISQHELEINIVEEPTVYIGEDTIICVDNTQEIPLTAVATNYSEFEWSTSGNGFFDTPNSLETNYFPSYLDFQQDSVTICLLAEPLNNDCVSATESCITIHFVNGPTLFAGDDATICHTDFYETNGFVENVSSVQWFTINGTGTFSSEDSIITQYYPGAYEIENGSVILSVQAEGIEPCQTSLFDQVTLTIDHCQDVQINEGWSGLSSFVNVNDPEIINLFEEHLNEISIIQDQNGFFWPEQNINTMGKWKRNSGYMIKAKTPFEQQFRGKRTSEFTINLRSNWNLMPVLSECPVNCDSVFNSTSILLAKEVAGTNVYWPDFNINTLNALTVGKAYFVLMEEETEITFPECDGLKRLTLSGAANENLTKFSLSNTAFTHTIAFSAQSPSGLVRAYDANGNCFGAITLSNNTTALTLFGNDPLTEEKDGFYENDQIFFRFTDEASGEEQVLDVEFDQALPNHNGTFRTNGLSAIKSIRSANTGIVAYGTADIHIYPNPATDILLIDLPGDASAHIEILNMRGNNVLKSRLNNRKNNINLSALPKGVYILQIRLSTRLFTQKLVIK